MKIYFYCSSANGKGYAISKFNEKTLTEYDSFDSGIVNTFMSFQGVNKFLLNDKSRYFLGVRNIKQPEDLPQKIVDISLSPIKINVVFCSKNEAKIRALAIYIIDNYADFKRKLYDAYDSDVPNAIGYSFSYDKINTIIVGAGNSDSSELITQKAKYGFMKQLDRNGLLDKLGTERIGKNEFFMAELAMSEAEYKEKFSYLPRYLLKKNVNAEASVEPQNNHRLLLLAFVVVLIFMALLYLYTSCDSLLMFSLLSS